MDGQAPNHTTPKPPSGGYGSGGSSSQSGPLLATYDEKRSFWGTKHSWKGKYKRVFAMTPHGFSTLNPTTMESTNQWPFKDVVSIGMSLMRSRRDCYKMWFEPFLSNFIYAHYFIFQDQFLDLVIIYLKPSQQNFSSSYGKAPEVSFTKMQFERVPENRP